MAPGLLGGAYFVHAMPIVPFSPLNSGSSCHAARCFSTPQRGREICAKAGPLGRWVEHQILELDQQQLIEAAMDKCGLLNCKPKFFPADSNLILLSSTLQLELCSLTAKTAKNPSQTAKKARLQPNAAVWLGFAVCFLGCCSQAL